MPELRLHSSADLEKMLHIPRPSLSSVAQRLPLSPHGRKGAVRLYTTEDAVLVHMAVELGRSGLLAALVVDMISEIKEHLLDVLHDPKSYYAVARLRLDPVTGRYPTAVLSDPTAFIAWLVPVSGDLAGGAAVFDLTALVEQFLEMRRAYQEQEVDDDGDN